MSIDQFSVTRNGAAFFTDSFDDGAPPPSGDGTLSYFVRGTIPAGAESGGRLLLDTANGVPSPNAAGAPRAEVDVTLLTNTDSSANALTLGLKSDDTLRVTGIFDLVTPTGPLFSAYGVRFHDNTGAPGDTVDQLLQLFVRYNDVTGQAEIAYILQDFQPGGGITGLGAVPLSSVVPAGADQIVLYIERPSTASNDFFGHFEFLGGGAQVPGEFMFITPGQMFQGEQFVRAQFFVAQGVAVPEPATLALLGLALAGLGFSRRRKQGPTRCQGVNDAREPD